MILYYLEDAIHEVPSFIYICGLTGGKVLTESPSVHAKISREFPGTDIELLQDKPAIEQRMIDLAPTVVVHTDYTARFFPKVRTKHVQVFHGESDKPYGYSKVLTQYSLVLLPGQKLADRIAKAGLLDRLNAKLVGYSKLDRVFRGELDRNRQLAELGLDPARPSVLYAPTWRDMWNNSSLPRYGREVVSGVPSDVNLIVKLHASSYKQDLKYCRMVEALVEGRPNVRMIHHASDIIPIMAASDLLISDISSVTNEYLAFNRPMVFLDPILHFGGKNATWVWGAGDVVRKKGRVWETVMARLAGPDVHRARREEYLRYAFYQPDGHATERAAQ
ncbi:MAG: CDP-glycerol glycerophosphotransferase family protein, partial [Chitinophagales bacterium]